jgi:hypothetical protein
MTPHCYTTTSTKNDGDGDAESLLDFDVLHASCSFFCFCYALDIILRLLVKSNGGSLQSKLIKSRSFAMFLYVLLLTQMDFI